MSSANQEELAKIDPATLQYLVEQLDAENVPAVREIVLDERIPREMEKHKHLQPKPYRPRPRPPPRQRKTRKMRELLREFEPAPRWDIRKAPGYQNELQDLYGDVTREGEEAKGRRFIRWRIIRGVDKDLTPNSLCMRHIFAYQVRNIEDGTVILYHKNVGSRWFEKLSEAEEWLREQETERLETDNTERPNTKWVFESFFNVEVKVVLDREPLMGTGP